jgi:hypothetical protein
MNWRRGTFRLVVVASICWGGVVAWISYQELVARPAIVAAATDACFSQRTADPLLGNPFGCIDPGSAPVRYLPMLELLIIPVGGAFIAWAVMVWAFAGFLPR